MSNKVVSSKPEDNLVHLDGKGVVQYMPALLVVLLGIDPFLNVDLTS